MKKSRLISERTIREAARTGNSPELLDDTLVTPAARDLAKDLGVPLLRPASTSSTAGPRSSVPRLPEDRRPADGRRIAIGSDHGGYKLKESLKPHLAELGVVVNDVGCHSPDPVDYPVYAAKVADLVAAGEAAFGIMIDGAGVGSAMVANKIARVRAALCYDLTTAKNAREHNDANVLTLGGGLIGERLAADIVRVFLATPFTGGRHQPRVAMIDALDRI